MDFPQSGFVSPGFAMAQTLQDILSRRKVEQRQSMLDSITAQNAASERALRASEIETAHENSASLKASREAQAKLDAANAFEKTRGNYGVGTDIAPEDVAQFQQFAPSAIKHITGSAGTPASGFDDAGNPSTPATPAVADHWTHLGTPKDQAAAQQRERAMQLMSNPEQFKGMDPRLVWAAFQSAGLNLPAELAQGDEPVYALDEATHAFTKVGAAPKGAHITNIPRPPQAPQGPSPLYTTNMPDKDGNEHIVTVDKTSGKVVSDVNMPYGKSGAVKPFSIAPSVTAMYRTALKDVADPKNQVGMPWSTKPSPDVLGRLQQARQSAVTQMHLHPDVEMSMVTEVLPGLRKLEMEHPEVYAALTPSEVAMHMQNADKLPPDQLSQLQAAIGFILQK